MITIWTHVKCILYIYCTCLIDVFVLMLIWCYAWNRFFTVQRFWRRYTKLKYFFFIYSNLQTYENDCDAFLSAYNPKCQLNVLSHHYANYSLCTGPIHQNTNLYFNPDRLKQTEQAPAPLCPYANLYTHAFLCVPAQIFLLLNATNLPLSGFIATHHLHAAHTQVTP